MIHSPVPSENVFFTIPEGSTFIGNDDGLIPASNGHCLGTTICVGPSTVIRVYMTAEQYFSDRSENTRLLCWYSMINFANMSHQRHAIKLHPDLSMVGLSSIAFLRNIPSTGHKQVGQKF
jgi:hypothetical protein